MPRPGAARARWTSSAAASTACGCDAAIVVTPHNVHVEGHFAVVIAGARRGARDRPLRSRHALARRSIRAAALPVVGVSYGGNDPAEAELRSTGAPRSRLRSSARSASSSSRPARDRPLDEHIRLGEAIARRDRQRAGSALVASADHGARARRRRAVRLRPGRRGVRRRASSSSLARSRSTSAPLGELVDAAKADSLWQLLVLQGAAAGPRGELLAYAAPTYYGMAVRAYAPHSSRGARPRPRRMGAHAAPEAQEKLRPKTPSRVKKRTKKAARAAQPPAPRALGARPRRARALSRQRHLRRLERRLRRRCDGRRARRADRRRVVGRPGRVRRGRRADGDAERARRRAPVPRRPRRRLVRPDGDARQATRAATSARRSAAPSVSRSAPPARRSSACSLLLVGALLLSGASLGAILRRSGHSCTATSSDAPPPRRPPRRSRRGDEPRAAGDSEEAARRRGHRVSRTSSPSPRASRRRRS